MSGRAASVLLLIACLSHASLAPAQGLPDPTRPPASWLAPDPKAVAKTTGEQAEVPVQLLLVGPTRRFAIVHGDIVGDKGTGTRIVEVKRNEVIVQSDRGREALGLFPHVQKTPPKKPAGMGKKE